MKKKKPVKYEPIDIETIRDHDALVSRMQQRLILYADEMAVEYIALNLDRDDLFQEGAMALLRAADTFRTDKATRFETYAEVCIKNAMTDLIRKEYPFYENHAGNVSCYHNTDPDEPDEGDTIISQVPDFPFIPASYYCTLKEDTEELHHALDMISEREKAYLKLRFGFEDGENYTQEDAARYFHLSKSRGRKTELLALDNCRLELPWWYDSRIKYKKKTSRERIIFTYPA